MGAVHPKDLPFYASITIGFWNQNKQANQILLKSLLEFSSGLISETVNIFME